MTRPATIARLAFAMAAFAAMVTLGLQAAGVTESISSFGVALLASITNCLGFYSLLRLWITSAAAPSETSRDATYYRVKQTFDTLAAGVLVLDNQFRISLCNASFARYVGRSADELPGIDIDEIRWTIEELGSFSEAVARLAISRCTQPSRQQNARIRLGSGSEGDQSYEINATLIHGDEGDARGYLVTLMDLTEREQNERQIESLTKQVESLGRSLQETQQTLEQAQQEKLELTQQKTLKQPSSAEDTPPDATPEDALCGGDDGADAEKSDAAPQRELKLPQPIAIEREERIATDHEEMLDAKSDELEESAQERVQESTEDVPEDSHHPNAVTPTAEIELATLEQLQHLLAEARSAGRGDLHLDELTVLLNAETITHPSDAAPA